jgi:hypothetical protein
MKTKMLLASFVSMQVRRRTDHRRATPSSPRNRPPRSPEKAWQQVVVIAPLRLTTGMRADACEHGYRVSAKFASDQHELRRRIKLAAPIGCFCVMSSSIDRLAGCTGTGEYSSCGESSSSSFIRSLVVARNRRWFRLTGEAIGSKPATTSEEQRRVESEREREGRRRTPQPKRKEPQPPHLH